MRTPRVKFTVRRMMLTAAVVAGCLSFAARAAHLRTAASGRVREFSARLARGYGRATPDDWRGYRQAEQDLHKADFLESFGLVVAILVPVAGAAVLLWPRRRPGDADEPDGDRPGAPESGHFA